jgi:hypothetical protein
MTWAELQEHIEVEGEPPICPVCESAYGAPLGTLGRLDWYRCVGCGIDFHKEADRA